MANELCPHTGKNCVFDVLIAWHEDIVGNECELDPECYRVLLYKE